MGDDLTIDNGTHAIGDIVFPVLFRALTFFFRFLQQHLLHPDVSNLHGSSVFALSIPALTLVFIIKVCSVDIALFRVHGGGKMLLFLQGIWNGLKLLAHLLLLLYERLFHFRLQSDGNMVSAVKHVLGDGIFEVTANDMI